MAPPRLAVPAPVARRAIHGLPALGLAASQQRVHFRVEQILDPLAHPASQARLEVLPCLRLTRRSVLWSASAWRCPPLLDRVSARRIGKSPGRLRRPFPICILSDGTSTLDSSFMRAVASGRREGERSLRPPHLRFTAALRPGRFTSRNVLEDCCCSARIPSVELLTATR